MLLPAIDPKGSERSAKDLPDLSTHRPETSSDPSLADVTHISDPVTPDMGTSDVEKSNAGAGNWTVDFDGSKDPYNPMNWTLQKKIYTTTILSFTTMGTTWASSIYSTGVRPVSETFNLGLEVSELGLTLFMLGLGTGPMLFAPLSEVFGRTIAILPPFFISACFAFATATAENAQTIFICRFFSGFFGSAPVAVTAGSISDIWEARYRAKAMTAYALAVIFGPLVAPVVGSALVTSSLGWRWTEYITGILILAILFTGIIFLDETYAPVLLSRKARKLRIKGDWAAHAKHEELDMSFTKITHKYLVRPFAMLSEPICFAMCLYASFVFGIIYMTFPAFPIVFQQIRGWHPVVASLPFLAVLFGTIIGSSVNLLNQKFYVKQLQANEGHPVPEARLPPMMIGGPILAAGLFIFGWTSRQDVHWFPSVIGATLIGFGYNTIFQAALNYLVDTYKEYAASAIAANTFLRCMLAGAFPLIAHPLFGNLGVDWGSSLLGFIGVALIPIPYLFYCYGKRIRLHGKWSRSSV